MKIVGTASGFKVFFIDKPRDLAITVWSSKQSSVKCALQSLLEGEGEKLARVFRTALVHTLAYCGFEGQLCRLTPSLVVLEHLPATHR